MENFKALLKMNIIKNCLITIEDVKIAEDIYGPDMSMLKGKSTRMRPNVVKNDCIKVPEEICMRNQQLELCMDVMFVNDICMMTTIDRVIKFRALVPLTDQSESELHRGLDVIL